MTIRKIKMEIGHVLNKWQKDFVIEFLDNNNDDKEVVDSFDGFTLHMSIDPANFVPMHFTKINGTASIYFIGQDLSIDFVFSADFCNTTSHIVILLLTEIFMSLGYSNLVFKILRLYIENRNLAIYHDQPILNCVGEDFDQIDLFTWCVLFIQQNDAEALNTLINTNWVGLYERYLSINPHESKQLKMGLVKFEDFDINLIMRQSFSHHIEICDKRNLIECKAILIRWQHKHMPSTEGGLEL